MLRVIALIWVPSVILSSRVSPACRWRIWRDFVLGRILANISIVKVTTYQNARTNESGPIVIDGTVYPYIFYPYTVCPYTFRNLPAIPVQEHPLGTMP